MGRAFAVATGKGHTYTILTIQPPWAPVNVQNFAVLAVFSAVLLGPLAFATSAH
jgi:hypothetical protein